MISQTEENYLKAIFKLSEKNGKKVSTNAIAGQLNMAAASVTDMVKRLAEKKLVSYQKYRGVNLTEEGKSAATNIIRKHRLWEVFLVKKLQFHWDEVHEIAEQLEHIKSNILTDRMDDFLGYPKFDPHGDPIPDRDGKIVYHKEVTLSKLKEGESGIVVAVDDHTSLFLQYLDKIKLGLNTEVKVVDSTPFDNSKTLVFSDGKEITVSEKVCENLLVKKL